MKMSGGIDRSEDQERQLAEGYRFGKHESEETRRSLGAAELSGKGRGRTDPREH